MTVDLKMLYTGMLKHDCYVQSYNRGGHGAYHLWVGPGTGSVKHIILAPKPARIEVQR